MLPPPLEGEDPGRKGSTALTTTIASTGKERVLSPTTIGADEGAAAGASAGAGGAKDHKDLARATKKVQQGQNWGQKKKMARGMAMKSTRAMIPIDTPAAAPEDKPLGEAPPSLVLPPPPPSAESMVVARLTVVVGVIVTVGVPEVIEGGKEGARVEA